MDRKGPEGGMSDEDGITIAAYESSLLDRFARLHHRYYGDSPEAKIDLIRRRFEHDYTREGSIIVVAMDGDQLVGTQTYTHWPYALGERRFKVIQSGMTLVDEDYRGRRLFVRMLAHGNELARERGVDFVTGFPHQLSYRGLERDGWAHVGYPRWFLRPLNLARILRRRADAGAGFRLALPEEHRLDPEPGWDGGFLRVFSGDRLHMPHDPLAFDYRYAWRLDRYHFFRDDPGDTGVIAVCKTDARHGFRELVIGDLLAREPAARRPISRALGLLIRAARRSRVVDAVSVLVNTRVTGFVSLLAGHGFVPIPKRAIFMVRQIGAPLESLPAGDWRLWNLMHSDIDTW